MRTVLRGATKEVAAAAASSAVVIGGNTNRKGRTKLAEASQVGNRVYVLELATL